MTVMDIRDLPDFLRSNHLTVIRSEWPIDSPTPILYTARVQEGITDTKPQGAANQTTIEPTQKQNPKREADKMKLNDVYPSRYLKPDDFEGELIATIEDVQVETFKNRDKGDEEKPVIHFAEEGIKPLIVNKTNWKAIAGLCGDESDLWPGKKITLGVMNVDAFGEVVAAVRVLPNRKAAKSAPAKVPQPAAAAVEPDEPPMPDDPPDDDGF